MHNARPYRNALRKRSSLGSPCITWTVFKVRSRSFSETRSHTILGNEADYVIVSVVRSLHSGFLRSRNRMNVLLTRCRQGLVIVSSRLFLDKGSGSNTLLGRLLAYWQSNYPRKTWIDWRSVAAATVDLPGFLRIKDSLEVHLPTIYSVTMPHTPKKFIPPPSQQITQVDALSFPPLVSKQPLLSGSWSTSVLPSVHPLSLVNRRRQPQDVAKASPQSKPPSPTTRIPWPRAEDTFVKRQVSPHSPLVTNTLPSANLKTNQRPFIHNLGRSTPNTRTTDSIGARTKSKKKSQNQKPVSAGVPDKQQTPNPLISVQSTGFIRSITIHSRNPMDNGITNTKKSGFAKRN